MEFVALYFVIWVAIGGLIGALIGSAKGRGGIGFLLGFLLGFIGWIIVALIEPTEEVRQQRQLEMAATMRYALGGNEPSSPSPPAFASTANVPAMRSCPWCAETIKAAAILCRFCGRDIEPATQSLAVQQQADLNGADGQLPSPSDALVERMRLVYGDRCVADSLAALTTGNAGHVDVDVTFEILCRRVSAGADPDAALRRVISEFST